MMTAYSGEIGTFWSHALPSEYISSGGCCVLNVFGTSGTTKTSPKPKIGTNNTAFIAAAYSTGLATTGSPNYYAITLIGAYTTTGGHYRLTPSSVGNKTLKPIELLALDQKGDDGIANDGNTRSGSFSGGWGVPSISANATCSTGATYYVNKIGRAHV